MTLTTPDSTSASRPLLGKRALVSASRRTGASASDVVEYLIRRHAADVDFSTLSA